MGIILKNPINSVQMGKQKKINLEDILPFGKYKGLPLKQVMENDFNYYKWLIKENVIKLTIHLLKYELKLLKVDKLESKIIIESFRKQQQLVRKLKAELKEKKGY